MRVLQNNKRLLWYSLPDETEPIFDDWGNNTGETKIIYTVPVKTCLNISAAIGQAAAQAFGLFSDYSRTIAAEKDCPLVVGARIWFNKAPPDEHNYVVVRVADSLNGVLFALQEVATSGS